MIESEEIEEDEKKIIIEEGVKDIVIKNEGWKREEKLEGLEKERIEVEIEIKMKGVERF